jgi:hypothetical protein
MGFTLKIFGTPVGLLLVGILIHLQSPHSSIADAFGMIGLIGCWVAFPVVCIYWLVRLVRRATRDSPDPYYRR